MKHLVRYVSAVFSCSSTVLAPMPKDQRVKRMEAQIDKLQELLNDMEARLEATEQTPSACETHVPHPIDTRSVPSRLAAGRVS